MSIAVSTVVHPSRILLALNGAMVVIAIGVAFAIGSGYVGDLIAPVRFALSGGMLFLAFFGFYHGMWNRKNIQLDISGTGQIRVLEVAETASCADSNRPHVRRIDDVVQLLDNSTIWPYMLVLRFHSKDGRNMVVSVLHDSVSRDSFRALSVAFRWISEQRDSSDAKIF